MGYVIKIVCCLLTTLSLCACSDAVYNVRDFGAVGDGKSLDSPAINAAIERASSEGGGIVRIPGGTYLCYSIRLSSDVCLEMEKGTVIRAADGFGFDYPEPGPQPQYQDYGHSHFRNSLIWGEDLENVTICGAGVIEGDSLDGGFDGEPVPDGKANKAISLKNCRHVILSDFTILRGGHFGLLATGVDDLLIRNLTVDTIRDGLDIDCCKEVKVVSCNVNCPWDDAIVLKSSYALGRFRDTENVVIRDCRVSGYMDGTFIDGSCVSSDGQVSPFYGAPGTDVHGGRIKIGTESSGSFRNIKVYDCALTNSGGLILNAMDGGVIEDVEFRNIKMTNVQDCPIFLRLGDRQRSPEGTPVGSIRRVVFSDISAVNANGRWPMMIAGIPGHLIEDITFRNVDVVYEGGFSSEGSIFPIPEKTAAYPDPWLFRSFGNGQDIRHNQYLPFRSLMLRHVKNIKLDGVSVDFTREDTRPDCYIDDASDISGLPADWRILRP